MSLSTSGSLGIPAVRGDRASFKRAALERGICSSWCCWRVATQPCWRHFYFVVPFLLEKKRKRYYLVLVSRTLFYCGFVDRQGKSSRRAKDSEVIKGSPGGQNRSKSIMTHRQVGFRTMNAYLTLVSSESSHHADSCNMSHFGLPPTDVAPAASTKSRSGA